MHIKEKQAEGQNRPSKSKNKFQEDKTLDNDNKNTFDDDDIIDATDDVREVEEEEEEEIEKPKSQKKNKKIIEEEASEYEDEDDDDEYDDGGRTKKIILTAVIGAAIIGIAGIGMYKYLDKQDNGTSVETVETVEDTESETDGDTESEVMTTEAETDEVITAEATATPKPLPTATPTITPTPQPTITEAVYIDENGTGGDGSDITAEGEQEIAGIVYLGDLRFRSMANVATGDSDRWECSASGTYAWMTETAFSDVDSIVGEGTRVLISMGINDLQNYQAYASIIESKAAEWAEKGAETYFVAVGPVDSSSATQNEDICTFNTYMYNNLSIPFIDVYNYLVENGFSTAEDGVTYTDSTSLAMYSYITSLL